MALTVTTRSASRPVIHCSGSATAPSEHVCRGSNPRIAKSGPCRNWNAELASKKCVKPLTRVLLETTDHLTPPKSPTANSGSTQAISSGAIPLSIRRPTVAIPAGPAPMTVHRKCVGCMIVAPSMRSRRLHCRAGRVVPSSTTSSSSDRAAAGGTGAGLVDPQMTFVGRPDSGLHGADMAEEIANRTGRGRASTDPDGPKVPAQIQLGDGHLT